MTKDEALKLALPAIYKLEGYAKNASLEFPYEVDTEIAKKDRVEAEAIITAIRKALAQPEQEPVKDENAIRADEREACAKACEKVAVDYYTRIGGEHEPYMRATAEDCARHIRARAQPEERNFCPRCGKRTADLTTIQQGNT